MIQALYSGVSGLDTFEADLNVIGNNIANVNTTAYKSSSMSFEDMMSQTISGGTSPTGTTGGTDPEQVGLGVNVGSIQANESQGALQSTGNSNDVAIQGGGYLMMGDGKEITYTRDGSLSVDANNNLVSAASGEKILGWTADPATGLIDTSQPPNASNGIQIPVQTLASAQQTTTASFDQNLDASAATGTTVTPNIVVYDSLGDQHTIDVTFTKTASPSEWSYSATCADASNSPIASGTMTFDSKGVNGTNNVPTSLTLATPNGSTNPMNFELSFGSITQDAGTTTVAASTQDGKPAGTLQGFTIGSDGTITGTYDNGTEHSIGRIALANFSNPQGLVNAGANTFLAGANSGLAQVSSPGTGSSGTLAAGFTESSNVDLSTEFTNMIVAQRGFEANSKIITVSDQILQDLDQLKQG